MANARCSDEEAVEDAYTQCGTFGKDNLECNVEESISDGNQYHVFYKRQDRRLQPCGGRLRAEA